MFLMFAVSQLLMLNKSNCLIYGGNDAKHNNSFLNESR